MSTPAPPTPKRPPLEALILELQAAVELDTWAMGPGVVGRWFLARDAAGRIRKVSVSNRGGITTHPYNPDAKYR